MSDDPNKTVKDSGATPISSTSPGKFMASSPAIV